MTITGNNNKKAFKLKISSNNEIFVSILLLNLVVLQLLEKITENNEIFRYFCYLRNNNLFISWLFNKHTKKCKCLNVIYCNLIFFFSQKFIIISFYSRNYKLFFKICYDLRVMFN